MRQMMNTGATRANTSGTLLALSLVCIGGCGATPTTTPRTNASPATTALTRRAPWVLVDGPHYSLIYATEEEGPDGSRCFTAGTARGCYRDGVIRDVVLGSGDRWFKPEGQFEGSWLFSDERGDLYVSEGFSGERRRVEAPPRTLRVSTRSGRFARLTVDGQLLRWNGERFETQVFPGRVYAADFFGGAGGLALVEPGAVYGMSDGELWHSITEPSPAPGSLSDVDPSTLPSDIAALRDRPAQTRSRLGVEETAELRRAWLTWLVNRFAHPSRPTLPTFLPELRRDLQEQGVVTFEGSSAASDVHALADGWVIQGIRQTIIAGPNLEVAAEYPGFSTFGVVSRDGRHSLRTGAACAGDQEDATDWQSQRGRACYASPSGERTIALPWSVGCASFVALSDDQLIVGGEGCPTELCGDHALVRIELNRQNERASPAIPIPLDSALETPARPSAEGCSTVVRVESSASIPEAGFVRARVETPEGDRLLVGPPRGELRVLRGPTDRGAVAFADRDHGVWVGGARAWVTEDGAETWRELDVPDAPLSSNSAPRERDPPTLASPICSRTACRVGGRFWVAPETAEQLRLAQRAGLHAPTNAPYFGGMWMDAEREPWTTAPPAIPRFVPGDSFVDISPAADAAPLEGRGSRTLGGVSAQPRAPGVWPPTFAWRGLRTDGSPYTVRVSPRPAEATDTVNEPFGATVAVSPNFALVLPWPPRDSPGASTASGEPPRLRVVDRRGVVSSIVTPLRPGYAFDLFEPQGIWSLTLPMGGLGVVMAHRGRRWLLQLDANGTIVHQRVIEGPRIRRDEFLEWNHGELGLTTLGVAGATFYGITTGRRAVSRPLTPVGPCAGEPNPDGRWVGSSWRGPGRGRGGVATPPGSWVVAEEVDGRSCIRHITGMWHRSLGSLTDNGVTIAQSVGGELRATYVGTRGVVPWRLDTEPCPECESGQIPRRRMRLPTSHAFITPSEDGLELFLLPTRRTDADDPPLPLIGRYDHTWGESALSARWLVAPGDWRVFRDLELAPGDAFLGRRHRVVLTDIASASVETLDRAVPAVVGQARTPTGQLRVFVGEGEDARSLIFEPTSGDAVRTVLASQDETRAHYVVRLSSDGSVVAEHFVRAPHGRERGPMSVVRVRSISATGRLSGATTTSAPLSEFGPFAAMEVVAHRREVLIALTSSREPHRVLRGRIGGRLRDEGGPIPTGSCRSRVLSISTSPTRIAWTDCPLGAGAVHIRTAELRGREWREFLPPLPVGGHLSAATYVHPDRGLFAFWAEGDTVALAHATSDGWRVIARLRRDELRDIPTLNVEMPTRP